ncbi:MAG: hypothetical protein Q9211_001000 [Gyalolechia sp. 1 TL-2023]
MFLIPPENVQKLKQEVIADPEAKGAITSTSDIVQALFWRAAIKARYRVAKELRGQSFGPDEISVLELPVDSRPYFSSLLPSSYMGCMLILNRPNMPVETLCSPETSIGCIAYLLREAAARITPSLKNDAFTLLQCLPDYSRFTLACIGLGGMHAIISNLMLFQTSEISFGDGFFADGGSPEAMRPQVERYNKRFRFLVIYPTKNDGSVELVLGTLPEELEMLKTDEEFTNVTQEYYYLLALGVFPSRWIEVEVNFFCWNSYFSPSLQVVNNLSITDASYVVQTYTVGSVLCSLTVGPLIHYTGRYKPVCLFFGIPLSILGLGLMIHFRRPDDLCFSFAAGTIIICDEIAIMAAASHQHIAVVLAVLGIIGSIGGAIGLTAAAAIWQDVFPTKLVEYLPASELPNRPIIYADITTQLSYAVGSPARIAIQHAYGDAQMAMLIAGTAVWAVGIVAVCMWRDINVIGLKQTKGHVF